MCVCVFSRNPQVTAVADLLPCEFALVHVPGVADAAAIDRRHPRPKVPRRAKLGMRRYGGGPEKQETNQIQPQNRAELE